MEQNDFEKILRKYLRGEVLPEERKMIDAWYASLEKDSDDHGAPEELPSDDFGWANIYAHVKKSKRRDNQKKLLLWYPAGIAASLIIAIVSMIFFVNDSSEGTRGRNTSESSLTWESFVNTTRLTQVIVLPDSSKVAIEPESKLKFSSVFNKTEREVYLEGEAFFQVTHNADVPFFVHANEVTTKVLGTSFIIKAIKSEREITVVVKTGKVSVFASPKKEEDPLAVKEIILTPNQQITYDKEEREISKTIVKKPQAILPEEEVRRMRFEEAPVTEIFKALEKLYGVEIDFDEALFSSCRLTTVISKDDLYSRLDIICNVIGTSYTLQQDRIVIGAAGCKAKTP